MIRNKSNKVFTSILLALLFCMMFVSVNFKFVLLVHANGITRVQGNARGTSASNNINVTMSSTPTSGNLLIAVIGTMVINLPFATVSSINQTSVTWTKQVDNSYSNMNLDNEIWAGVVSSGASKNITVNLSHVADSGGIVDVCEYSGLATACFLDQTATATGQNTTTSTGTTFTTTHANELWIGSVNAFTIYSQSTPQNGFTLLDGDPFGCIGESYLEKIVSSTGQASSGTTIPSTNYYDGCIATFGDVPSDLTPPTFGTITSNSTLAGNATQISCAISDNVAVSSWGFAWNNSGSWVDSSKFAVSGTSITALYNGTYNSTIGDKVSVRFWANDSSNNAAYSSIQTFLLHSNIATYLNQLFNITNWTSSIYTYYVGYQFGEYNLTQLQTAIDMIPNEPSSYSWKDVLYWYATCAKYGIENQTTIKWALDNATIMSNGLPLSTTDSGMQAFSVGERYLLYGFYYAQKYGYGLSKWNITTAYDSLVIATNNGTSPAYYIRYDNTINNMLQRYYDENAETMDCFVDFYSFGVTSALTQAVNVYNYTVNNYYGNWFNGPFGNYFEYSLSMGPGIFECEAGGFLQLVEKLRYYNSTLNNATLINTDIETRLVSQEWNSPQWTWLSDGYPQGIIIHARNAGGTMFNSQYRLQNTLMAWSAIYGISNALTTSDRNNIIDMLLGGNSAPYPAGYLTYLGLGGTSGFKWESDGSITPEATAAGMTLMALQGVVPINTTLAIPLQDNKYQDIANLIDHDIFNINLTSHMVTISLESSGTVTFLYGSPINYTFTNGQGVYQVQFASGWNSISSVTYKGALPSGRIYLFNAGAITTVYASPSTATVQIGQTQNFTVSIPFGVPPYTYQWYYSNNTSIGGNSSTLSITPTVNGAQIYYCNVTDSTSSSAISNTVTLNVGLAPLSITFANTTAVKVNPSGNFYMNGTLVYNGTSIVPASGLATIYVSSLGNLKGQTTSWNVTSGNFNFSVTADNSVGNWSYTVYAVNDLGPSVVNQTLYVVSDKMIISLNTDTTAPTGGGPAHMNATASYAFDGLNVSTLGVTIVRNGTAYSYSTSWIDSEASGTVYNFTVSAANDTTYGLTAFSSNVLTIAWGQTVIEVSNIIQNSTRTGIGQAVQLNYQVIYGGNLTAVNSGNLIINGTNRAIVNGWANFTVTDSNITLNTYIASGSDINGTVFSQLPANPQIVFDEASIVLYFTSTSPQAGQNIVITWTITRLYDNSTVSNYNMTINVNYAPVYQNITQAVSSITDSLSGTGSKTYSVGSFIDSDYNMTSYMNTPQTVSWSTIPQGGTWYNPIVQTSAVTYSVKVIVTNNLNPLINVQVVINGQISTTDTSGIALFTLAEGNYPITISGNGQLLYTSSIQITNSTASPQMIYIDIAPPSVIPTTINPVAIGIITIVAIIILALAASAFNQKETGKQWIRRQDRDSRKHVKQKFE